MKRYRVVLVGCGDLGARCGGILLERGWEVAGVRRDASRLPPGFRAIAADYTVPGSLDFLAALRPDYVVAFFAPSDRSATGYQRGFTLAARHLVAGLGEHRPAGMLMVSSTRVFAERAGGWVDEHSPLANDDSRALAIIAAEQLLQGSPHRACVVRCAGLYGAPGGRLLDRVKRGDWAGQTVQGYGNRIHREDCAGFLAHLLTKWAAGADLASVYIAADDLPAPQLEVARWLAAQLHVPGPPGPPPGLEQPRQTGHKRCSNRLLHESGYRLLYPDYRSGYAAVLVAGQGRDSDAISVTRP
ncbi:MAG: NAD(P)H-binding protein [Halieaceae bacterium]|nr:NAD(P)H-binding protein [Halieaceae bacterium]MCP5163565.1 NAD(P)H-binding protein [Pseudomonadales bacterium]MCP5204550.1 NAD(P)H-binding protein [Pseudomonadales bacterium]